MATDVKKQIAQVFKEQAQRVGLDKVTIGAIVSQCHISRQAFYYYYQDIVDVARFLLKEQLAHIRDGGGGGGQSSGSREDVCKRPGGGVSRHFHYAKF